MNRERVLAGLVQIDVVVHELQRIVALDGAHAAGQVLAMAGTIRREADSLGGEVFMETLAATVGWRQWGERRGTGEAPAVANADGRLHAGGVAVQLAAPADPAPASAGMTAGMTVEEPAPKGKRGPKPKAAGSFMTRKGDLADLLPLRDFIEMREDGITYDAIARQLGVGQVIVARYGKTVLPKDLQDMKGRSSASDARQPAAEDEGGDEEDGE